MILWGSLSALFALFLGFTAYRMEGGQTLGAKQAVYLGAFCALGFTGYSVYQLRSAESAPSEIEAYLPVYPASRLRNRVPVRELHWIQRVFSNGESPEDIRGQWVFESSDSTTDVGRYYEQWAATAPNRVGVEIMMAYSEVVVDAPNYSFNVLANNQWGKTRITYTLMAPLD